MANKDVPPIDNNIEPSGLPKRSQTNYDSDIERAQIARNNQLRDTDPRIEKEGFLGVDDLDRLRRRNVKHITTPK